MNPFKSLRRLLPPAPLAEIVDPVLGVLRWDRDTKSWLSTPIPPEGRITFQIQRYKRQPSPSEACIRVAQRVFHEQDRLAWLLRVVLDIEADKRPESMRSAIRSLKITRILLRREDSGSVGGEMELDGKPPLYNWFCWHSNGNPVGVAQQWES